MTLNPPLPPPPLLPDPSSLQVLLVLLATLIPPLVVHAEGRHVKKVVSVFIPEWLLFGCVCLLAPYP